MRIFVNYLLKKLGIGRVEAKAADVRARQVSQEKYDADMREINARLTRVERRLAMPLVENGVY